MISNPAGRLAGLRSWKKSAAYSFAAELLLGDYKSPGFNRLGHFFTPDFKSGGTPSGLAFFIKIRRDAWRGCVLGKNRRDA